MNQTTLEIIKNELAAELTGRGVGKIFQLGKSEFAFDFRLAESRYLYINVTAGDPALYLMSRRLRDLEKLSANQSPFPQTLRKRLSRAEVAAVERVAGERVLEFRLTAEDEFGLTEKYRLFAQLTGRSANLLLTDDRGVILDRARDTAGDGQQIGAIYRPPFREGRAPESERSDGADHAVSGSPNKPSEALDAYYADRAAERRFQSVARSARQKISAEIRKREKLIGNLNADLAAHGDAEEWKRLGDLLLSNAATARREGGQIFVIDYFNDALPEIAVAADESDSITEAAEKYYRRYTKARNGAAEISSRIEKLSAEVASLKQREAAIDQAVAERDLSALEDFAGLKPKEAQVKLGRKAIETASGIRRFISSDGFEIMVGKKAKDNDQLTFKTAKSLDTWMHAADYPGSHVVVRNPNRVEVPQKTMHEAAQLAAFYSQGKSQVKAAVHYTQKKFVNKPKGAAPGLVSLASFKTLLVEPKFPEGVEAA